MTNEWPTESAGQRVLDVPGQGEAPVRVPEPGDRAAERRRQRAPDQARGALPPRRGHHPQDPIGRRPPAQRRQHVALLHYSGP